MQLSRKIFVFYLLVGIVILSGCAKYKPRSLQYCPSTVKEKDNFGVGTKILSYHDCEESFYTKKIIEKGYRPLQISVTNKTDKTYVLKGSNIGLQLEHSKLVARKCHINIATRVSGWAIGGIFFWPLFIAAASEGYNSYKANNDMDADFKERSISNKDKIFIPPHSSMNKVIFVSDKNYKSHFDIDFIEKESDDHLLFHM